MTSEDDGRHVLELRIHGVNNTGPSSMLDRPEVQIEQIDGDKLGSFWQVKTARLGDRGPLDRGHVPPSVRREAYSWGGMARSSPGAGSSGMLSSVLNGLGRIGWTLLLPFGLANVAYWSRALPVRGMQQSIWWGGRGARGMRLFGLGLTVLLISTVCEIALDLYAVQCRPVDRSPLCTEMPRQLKGLSGSELGERLANASLVPVVVLLGLWFLTARSRSRYEAITPPARVRDDGGRLLARSALWQGGEMVRGLTRLHVAASACVIVIASAWPAVFASGPSCRDVASLPTAVCFDQVAAAPHGGVFLWILVAAVALLAGSVMLTVWRIDDAPDVEREAPATEPDDEVPRNRLGIPTLAVLVASLAVLAVEIGALHMTEPTIVTMSGNAFLPLPTVNAVPVIVVAVLVGIATSALAWRSQRRRLPGVLGFLVAGGLLVVHLQLWVGIGLVAVSLLGLVVLAVRLDGGTRRYVAWRGTGPGLLLALSLTVALTLSTLIVVGVGDWLNGPANASKLAECDGPTAARSVSLCIPPVFQWFGAALTVTIGLLIVLVIVLAVRLAARNSGRASSPPSPSHPPSGPPSRRVRKARNLAALAHRAESITALIAGLGLLTVVVSVAGAAMQADRRPTTGALAAAGEWLADNSALFVGLAAAGVIAAVSGGGVLTGHRPLGLAWDLLCVLPRAAHPFTAPCYAERAVPEVTGRIRRWLSQNDHTVVVSAHSLGAVLAVAVVFMLDAKELQRTSLITYGAQLRAYFSRIFPDLFGPDVLGVPGEFRQSKHLTR